MDSRLDPVLPPPPRQAQPTDTRQEIRRHDPHDDHRPKSGKQEADPDALAEEETPRVSVSSLIVFLENLLTAQPASPGPQESQAPPAPEASPPGGMEAPPPPPQERAAAAAQAYRHAGHSGSTRMPTPAAAPSSDSPASPLLEAEDMRTIHALLPLLRDLAARGVETLVLEKAARFLDCLVNAALKARDAG